MCSNGVLALLSLALPSIIGFEIFGRLALFLSIIVPISMLLNGNIRFITHNPNYHFNTPELKSFRFWSIVILVGLGLFVGRLLRVPLELLLLYLSIKASDFVHEWLLALDLQSKNYSRYLTFMLLKVLIIGLSLFSIIWLETLSPYVLIPASLGLTIASSLVMRFHLVELFNLNFHRLFAYLLAGSNSILDSLIPQIVKYGLGLLLTVDIVGVFQNTIIFIVALGFISSSLASTWISEISNGSRTLKGSLGFPSLLVLLGVSAISVAFYHLIWRYYYVDILSNTELMATTLLVLCAAFFFNAGVFLSFSVLAMGKLQAAMKANAIAISVGIIMLTFAIGQIPDLLIGISTFTMMQLSRTVYLFRVSHENII